MRKALRLMHSLAQSSPLQFSSASSHSRMMATAAAAFEPGDVLKLSYQSHEDGAPDMFASFALSLGRGRVIHMWATARTNFRVRIDSLRVLEGAGLVATSVTEHFDHYCEDVIGIAPLSAGTIVTRARCALHATVKKTCLTLPLIVWARYGDVAITMAKSLFSILPTMARLVGIGAPTPVTSDYIVDTLAEAIYDTVDSPDLEDGGSSSDRLEIGSSFEAECEVARASVTDIRSLYASGIGSLLAEWIKRTYLAVADLERSPHRTIGMVVSLPDAPLAYLIFNRLERFFCVLYKSDGEVIDRLVRDRLECGVCFTDLCESRIKLLECSHTLCQKCLDSLVRRVCPFCREAILFIREVSVHAKLVVLARIRELETQGLAANDVDAPESYPPPRPRVITAKISEPVDTDGYDADVDDTDDSSSFDDYSDELVESLAMQLEDMNALTM